MSLADAMNTLFAAVKTVEGIRPYFDVSANLAPPAVVIGTPEVEYEGFNSATAGNALVSIYLVVAAGDRETERLVAYLDAVVQAVYDATDFAVTQAIPGTFTTGGTELPCYVLTVQMGSS